MKKRVITENRLLSLEGGVPQFDPKFKFITNIKANMLDVKSMMDIDMKFNQTGVEFIFLPTGQRGIQINYTDGSTDTYVVTNKGKLLPCNVYEDGIVGNTLSRRLERLFGLSDKNVLKPTVKNDIVHLIMFLVGATLAGGLVGCIAWMFN